MRELNISPKFEKRVKVRVRVCLNDFLQDLRADQCWASFDVFLAGYVRWAPMISQVRIFFSSLFEQHTHTHAACDETTCELLAMCSKLVLLSWFCLSSTFIPAKVSFKTKLIHLRMIFRASHSLIRTYYSLSLSFSFSPISFEAYFLRLLWLAMMMMHTQSIRLSSSKYKVGKMMKCLLKRNKLNELFGFVNSLSLSSLQKFAP